MAVTIHPTAIVDPAAQLADGVEVGPFTIIEANTTIGENTKIGHHSFIASGASIGKECVIHHSAVIANVPQDLKFKGSEETTVEIGDNVTIREFATIHRATIHSYKGNAGTKNGVTRIGNNCLIMAYAHVAHDCSIGNNVILSNGVQVAGHCTIESYVTVGGLTGVHQFSMIGSYSMVGAVLLVSKDIPPYSLIGDQAPRFIGINRIGLERRGFTSDVIRKIRDAYKLIYHSGMNVSDALKKIDADPAYALAEIQHIAAFIRSSDRGIISK